jgi:hypothetical protein
LTLAELRTDVVILACATSAGIHGALAPDHFEEGIGAGLGFVGATVLLAGLAIVLTRKPAQLALVATVAVFPVLHPEAEAIDGLALFTKAIEAVGLVLGASLVRPSLAITLRQPKGTLT